MSTAESRPKAERHLRAYVRGGHRAVRGWLSTAAMDYIVVLAGAQTRLGVSGNVCEIGIHHGKLFILLDLLRTEGQRSVAYDLFEMQDENVDRSGLGDKAKFLHNLRRHGCDGKAITVRSKNSLALTADEIRADAGGPIRLFSVDGGHTADITASDMALAESVLCPGGLLILDDFFNEAWPGVAEGAARHLASGSGLVPVAIGGNKFIFTTSLEFAAAYRAALADLPSAYARKSEIAFGRHVVVVQPKRRSLVRALAGSWLWRSIRTSRGAPALRALALRLLSR